MYSANWTPRAWFYQGRGFYQVRSVVNRLDAGGGRALSLHLLLMGHRRIQGQGKGYGRQLMEYCLANAKAREKAGVCMLGAKTQKAWLSGQAFAEKYGFETVDTTPDGYRLLVLSFDGTKPWFTENAKRLEIAGQKLTIYYSPSVPISIRVWNWYARSAKRCGRLIPSFWWILWKKPKPCLVHSTTGRYFIRESS
ncbi:Uncharacterised protein [Anaerotruncus colihominis]|mgnify:FL=1|nr:Uncharacterised protein [Anaerotruncus colihominis]